MTASAGASHAKRAIRFFGMVHSSLSTVRRQPNPLRLALTPGHIVKTLCLSSVVGLVSGYKFMESMDKMEQREQDAKLHAEYQERFGRRYTTMHASSSRITRRETLSTRSGLMMDV
mmetsp:Transcript_19229/g.24767  ORF Transcript_19229/g.24767 Transcript_19229/m.24767 type:complete len:116 (+) Transcript_19229:187-534(+)|eukprot:CAMPEP_0198145418 /NCGR_PEP_ID=MMETSP1443-20131203/23336_1 /TAXON_ID=186043 /ORGANISM="Entomoneis sp., Strain CCMP2396" /LENGTH=115 /DNA_ID=CAMNT_0043809061 /DNA_START=133 /DNA_END=480 /DNA_ORIENTATION=-